MPSELPTVSGGYSPDVSRSNTPGAVRQVVAVLITVVLAACNGGEPEAIQGPRCVETRALADDEISLSPVNRAALEGMALLRLTFVDEEAANDFASFGGPNPGVFDELTIDGATRRRNDPGWILSFTSEELRDTAACRFVEEGTRWWTITEVEHTLLPDE